MILTIDNLATRYHVLPSYALEHSDTFDLYVMDVATKWNHHKQELEKHGGKITKEPTQDELLAILNKTKGLN